MKNDQAKFIPVLRQKLTEVGLPGVRIIASPHTTSGEEAIFQESVLPYYDYHSHHYFDNKGPYDNQGKVLDWGGSYRPNGYFNNTDNFRMGNKENIDDYVQLKSWLLLKGAATGMNTWQLVNRLGIHERRGPFASSWYPHTIYGSNAETEMDEGDLRMVDSGSVITPSCDRECSLSMVPRAGSRRCP